MLLHKKDLEEAISLIDGRDPDVDSCKGQLRTSISGINASMDVINSLERAIKGEQS